MMMIFLPFQVSTSENLGKTTPVTINYFKMTVQVPDIFQYDVKFDPEIESQGTRNVILAAHKNKIGEFILDGAVLFLQKNIGNIDIVTPLKSGKTYKGN